MRTFVRGKLRVQTDSKHEELLPADKNDLDCRMSNGFSCFKSGDVRVNEHPSLVGKSVNLTVFFIFFVKFLPFLMIFQGLVSLHIPNWKKGSFSRGVS